MYAAVYFCVAWHRIPGIQKSPRKACLTVESETRCGMLGTVISGINNSVREFYAAEVRLAPSNRSKQSLFPYRGLPARDLSHWWHCDTTIYIIHNLHPAVVCSVLYSDDCFYNPKGDIFWITIRQASYPSELYKGEAYFNRADTKDSCRLSMPPESSPVYAGMS